MIPKIRKLEQLIYTAPLGLRFRDVVTGEFVGSGLRVVAYLEANPKQILPLYPNRRGIYVLHHAPGLRDFQQRPVDQVWQTPLPDKPYVIEVRDEEERFLPFQLTINLPVKGIYSWVSLTPGYETGIPLYPAKTRQSPTGMAVIRAELFDLILKRAASGAVIEADFNSRLVARGIADETGQLVLIFQYPAPSFSLLSSPVGSPLNGGNKPLHQQEWSLVLRAKYSPPISPLPSEGAGLPNLLEVLGQRQTNLWDDVAMTRPINNVTLKFGRELILRSSEGSLSSPVSPPAKPSVLFITPA